MRKLIIKLLQLCALCPLFFTGLSYAITTNWTNLCDMDWDGETIQLNNGGSISPLDLTTTPQDYVQTVKIWCYNIPDDTTTAGQFIKLGISSQNPTSGSTLALNPINRSVSPNTLPFEVCMGGKNDKLLCISQLGTQKYAWGPHTGNTISLGFQIFRKTQEGDPSDQCRWYDPLAEQNCSLFPHYKGPYSTIAQINFVTTPSLVANAPPAPGKYTDIVHMNINGNVGTSDEGVTAVDFASHNKATITLDATLSSDCRIDSAPDVSMNGSFSSQLKQQQQIGVTCTNTTPYTMSFTGANDITGWHQMKSETNDDMLRYQIYSNLAHTKIWDNTQSFTGSGLEQTYQLYYATDPSQANLPAGTYQDTETLTVSY